MAKGTSNKPFVKTTLSEQTYEALKERIFDQTLQAGERLNIGRLSKELDVSSSPIREALARLEAERLVVSEHYAGYSVAPQPDLDYLHQLLDFRILIEGHCARIGASKKRKPVLQSLRQTLQIMADTPKIGTKYREYRRFILADGRFHQALVESAESSVISDLYASLHVIILQSRLYLKREGGSISSDAVVDEHARILHAFEEGDGEAAAEAVRHHLESGRRRLLQSAERAAEAERAASA
ncbi:MAG TPA: GntR family transcriptional regulator [Kiloniellales bacterium]|jgi:DNA-binding GntR family transcriptional regulator